MPAKVTSTGLYLIPDLAKSTPTNRLPSAEIDVLPAQPGVYVFRDSRGRALYIGKSVNIRSRVRQHLRNGEQAGMLALARHVEAIETAGEIGALLLELSLVRKFQPPFNCLLRVEDEPWVLARDDLRLFVCRASNARGSRVYGAFASRGRAGEALEALLRQEKLCPGLAGLESVDAQRGCFSHQLQRCDGACAGLQPLASYRRRLTRALTKMEKAHWPFAGPVGLTEERPGFVQTHVLDRWDYLGTHSQVGEAVAIDVAHAFHDVCRPFCAFDADVYRIVFPFLARKGMRVTPLPACTAKQLRPERRSTC